MNLTRMALEKSRVSLIVGLLILFGGVLAFFGLPKAEDPGFTLRVVTVQTKYPGATPRRVEELVSTPIESALQTIPEIALIESTSRAGFSLVKVEIDDTIDDLAPIHTLIRSTVEDAAAALPSGAHSPAIDTDAARVHGIVLALIGPDFDHQEVAKAAEDLGERMLRLEDTASVEYVGVQDREVVVIYDHAALAAAGLSPQALVAVLQQSNLTTPGGDMVLLGQKMGVVPSGAFESAADVRELPVLLPGGGVVRMGDVATVHERLVSPAQPEAFHNGQPAILVGVNQREGGDASRWGRDVREAVAGFQQVQPIGLDVSELAFLPDDVNARISNFTSSLVQATVIVFVVMLLFLGVRTGSVIASTIPLVVLATFVLMQLFGVGIDQMSLAALIISLGMLVDNAIVMSEASQVRMSQGQTANEAVIDAAAELRIPLLVSSLTTIAAFLPIILSPGNSSEFVAPIFQVVAISLLSSWGIALTLLPVLLVTFLKPEQQSADGARTGRFYRAYRSVLRWALGHRAATVGVAVASLVAGVFLFRSVPNDFFPPSETPSFTVDIELPSATTDAVGREAMDQVRQIINNEFMVGSNLDAGVVSWGAVRGDKLPRFKLTYSGPPRAAGTLALLVRTTDRDVIDTLGPVLEQRIAETLPGARVQAKPLVVGPGDGADVAMVLTATSEHALWSAVEATKDHLRTLPGVVDVSDDWGPREQTLSVVIDPVRLRLAGVTHQDVGTALRSALVGLVATELYEGDEAITVRMQSQDNISHDVTALRGLTVFGAQGPVALDQLATIELVSDFGKIKRSGRERAVEVEATVNAVNAADVQAEILRWVNEHHGDSVAVEGSGAGANSSAATARLLRQAPLAAGLIALLLVIQFNSLRRVTINLIVLPFAFTGVAAGLLVLNSSFGFIALLGLISLFGILLNNGIVLIDRIDLEVSEGRPAREAVVEAAVQRVRPILLTTATTVLGLVPLYLGGGPTFQPMSVVLMGGLSVGTLVTLVLVPVCYAVVFRVAEPIGCPGVSLDS